MPRKHPSYRTDCPYHVTARTNNQAWFQLPMTKVWDIFQNQLFFIHHAYGIQIHAFVLMTNHFHLLISDPDGNLSKALRWLMTETSREINALQKSKNHLYGQRHYRTLISSSHYFLHAYKYVYRNPIEAGACNSAEEYPFSTLRGLLGMEKMIIPLSEDTLLGEDLEGTLRWINSRPEIENYEAVRMALKKSDFKLKRNRQTRRDSPLEFQRY
jgi:putative transposase